MLLRMKLRLREGIGICQSEQASEGPTSLGGSGDSRVTYHQTHETEMAPETSSYGLGCCLDCCEPLMPCVTGCLDRSLYRRRTAVVSIRV